MVVAYYYWLRLLLLLLLALTHPPWLSSLDLTITPRSETTVGSPYTIKDDVKKNCGHDDGVLFDLIHWWWDGDGGSSGVGLLLLPPSGPEMLDDMVDRKSAHRASITTSFQDTCTFQAAGNMPSLSMHKCCRPCSTETYQTACICLTYGGCTITVTVG